MSVGSLTAASARDDDDVIQLLAEVVNRATGTVRRRLREAPGKKLVRNVFEDVWPDDADSLGRLRVKIARDAGLEREIADVTDLPERGVTATLGAWRGNVLVRTAFEAHWPDEDEDEGEDDVEENDDLDDEDGDDAEVDDLESEEDEGDDDDDDDEDESEASELAANLHVPPDGSWSRARSLQGVLRALGQPTVQRLRTSRYREVLAILFANGIELRLVRNAHPEPPEADSPGIVAKVSLRLRSTESSPPRAAPPRPPAPPPIVVVAPPAAPRRAPAPPRKPDYGLALDRLHFLTGVPSVDREHEPAWPDEYVEAALEGLSVDEQERNLVALTAHGLVRGGHRPGPAITDLVLQQAHHDLDGLLAHFARLNGRLGKTADAILAWVEKERAARGGAPVATPIATNPPPRVESASSAPARAKAAAPTATKAQDTTNARNLGPLEGMFDDL